MPDVIISPNMSMPVPIVGLDPGPDWANNLNACLGILDQHTHAPGQGVQITPSSININSDLPFNDNNITLLKTVNFQSQVTFLPGTPPNLGCLYVAGNELVYNDESGNVVPITNTGSVNAGAGSITGLPSGTASASYSAFSQTFVWQSATNTPANMDNGSITLRNIVANSFGVTMNPQNAMGADYSITLPPPNSSGNTAFLTYDTSNNIAVGPSTNGGITASMLDPSIAFSFNPSGAITMFGGTVAPTGYLICDGSAINRTSFSNLFTAIGTAYGVGDGSTTFNIPDFRGLFPRGVDNGAGNDPDAGSRTAVNGGNSGDAVGSFQGDQNLSHSHVDAGHIHSVKQAGGGVGVTTAFVNGSITTSGNAITNFSGPVNSGNANIQLDGGNQSNPKNLYVNFIIKT